MVAESEIDKNVSVFRLRLGVVFFILFWVPAYLAVPSIVRALGYEHNTHAVHIVTAIILIIQGLFGIIGVLLLGKGLALTLKKVKYKKLPITIWRMIWSGQTSIDASYLKPPKNKEKIN